uniref:Uncharacterized protein n=2 Tax=Proboscia inermis TaxID=420281 RepID=A0A7S0BZH6_9STRA|mmetsp:Transcript_16603/g.16785  ORF Transcript_16603/g.16785 Transcript_16603/m.16785 type:complete len:169 (+) Transcript_16603:399-905(+)
MGVLQGLCGSVQKWQMHRPLRLRRSHVYQGLIVVEGIYWASLSYVGGLYTLDQAGSTKNKWLMVTPEEGMMVLPESVDNAIFLKKGSPALYDLMSDTTSEVHAWLPAVMIDGTYMGVPVKEKCTDEEAAVKWMYKKKGVKIKGTCGSLEEDTQKNIAKACNKSQPKKK